MQVEVSLGCILWVYAWQLSRDHFQVLERVYPVTGCHGDFLKVRQNRKREKKSALVFYRKDFKLLNADNAVDSEQIHVTSGEGNVSRQVKMMLFI